MFRRGEGMERHPDPIDPKEVLMKESPGSEVTVIGQGARIEGTLVSAGSLRIDGQVTGKINADGDVVLSSQSQVEADIDAQNATVAGRFKGNILVKNKAEAELERALALDEQRRGLTVRVDELRAEQNRGSKEVKAASTVDEREAVIQRLRSVS